MHNSSVFKQKKKPVWCTYLSFGWASRYSSQSLGSDVSASGSALDEVLEALHFILLCQKASPTSDRSSFKTKRRFCSFNVQRVIVTVQNRSKTASVRTSKQEKTRRAAKEGKNPSRPCSYSHYCLITFQSSLLRHCNLRQRFRLQLRSQDIGNPPTVT